MTPKAEESLKYTLATLAIEKVTPRRRTIRLCEKITEGRISADSAVEQIKRYYGIESRHPK